MIILRLEVPITTVVAIKLLNQCKSYFPRLDNKNCTLSAWWRFMSGINAQPSPSDRFSSVCSRQCGPISMVTALLGT